MKCPQCGAEAVSGAIFCQKCGERLPAETTQPPGRTVESAPSAGGAAASAAGRTAAAAVPGGMNQQRTDVPEELLWEGGYSPKAMIGHWLLAAVISVVLLGVGSYFGQQNWWWVPLAIIPLVWLVVLMQFLHRRLGIHYKLTNQRFFHESGVLTHVTNRIEVIDIDDLEFEQGLLDRMVGVGRIKVVSTDQTSPDLWIEGIENVQEVFGLIDKARRAERIRRGFVMQQVQ